MSWTFQHTTRLSRSTSPTESSTTVQHTTRLSRSTSPTECLGLSNTPDCLDQHHIQNVLECPTHNQIVKINITYRMSGTVQHTRLSRSTSPTECLGLSNIQPDCLNQHHLQNVWDCPTHNQIVYINITYRMSWTVQHTTRLSRSRSSTECLGPSNIQPDSLDQDHLQNV